MDSVKQSNTKRLSHVNKAVENDVRMDDVNNDSLNEGQSDTTVAAPAPDDQDGKSRSKSPQSRASNRRQYPCATCNRSFGSKRDLVTHQYMHRENPKLFCSECNKTFTTETTFARHVRSHVRKSAAASGGNSNNRSKKSNNLECSQCGATFDSKRELVNHHTSKHVDEKRFQCEICGSQYAWPENLRVHKLSHEINPHECTKCGRRFVDATSLRVHTRNMHGPDSQPSQPRKAFSCQLCGRAFQFDFSLRAHMKGHLPTTHAEQMMMAQADSQQQPHYIHVDQEGIIDLSLMSGSNANANEIIVEVYNYDGGQISVGNQNSCNLSIQHNFSTQEITNAESSLLVDAQFQNNGTGEAELSALEPSVTVVNSNNKQEFGCEATSSHSNGVSMPEQHLQKDCTNGEYAVSIPVNVSLCMLQDEKLDDSKEVSVATNATTNASNLEGRAKTAMVPDMMERQNSVQAPAAGSCSMDNANLVWYAPPEAVGLHQPESAMIFWYQEPGNMNDAENSAKQTLSSVSLPELVCSQDAAAAAVQEESGNLSSYASLGNNQAQQLESRTVVPAVQADFIAESSLIENPSFSNEISEVTSSKPSIVLKQPLVSIQAISSSSLGRRTGRKSRPREPFLFNCVMTDEKPFVCIVCGQAFRWEISLNVHYREHTEQSASCKQRGKTAIRLLSRGGGKTRRTGTREGTSNVGRSRIVPRTASSDEDADDEFCFRVQPDEENDTAAKTTTKRRGGVAARKNSVGRRAARGTRRQGTRGRGVRTRGNISTAENGLQNGSQDTVACNSSSAVPVDQAAIMPAYFVIAKENSDEAAGQLSPLVGTAQLTSLNNVVGLVGNDETMVHSSLTISQQLSATVDNQLVVDLNDLIANGGIVHMNSASGSDTAQCAVLLDSNGIVVDNSLRTNGNNLLPLTTPAYNKQVFLSKSQQVLRRSTFMCFNCMKLFTRRAALHRHQQTVHSQGSMGGMKRSIGCVICSSIFSSRWDLLRHRRACHTAGKLRCPQCAHVFSKKSILDRHRRRHFSVVKPSVCACGKKYFIQAKVCHSTQQEMAWRAE